ncbi:hypothetical protein [Sphingomonas sp. 1P08PE]|uniref:hypothetical protein n=1 Tax=Sphingomonas sp. 1P08PE TaxID=554122 RepID=UPI0039A3A058
MDSNEPLDRLHDHQRRALDILARGAAALDAGLDRERTDLRAEMADVLRDYQIFKHEEVFDPAVSSGSAERAMLGRAMKIECIAAGEAFRTHSMRWKDEAIVADPANYRAAARLTLNALRRHIEREGEGITLLLTMLTKEMPKAA